MNSRVFIIHGLNGHPQKNWFPWLKAELTKRGFEVHVPQMPRPEAPDPKAWAATIAKYVGIPDEHTYFVGHSLGCVAILRFLEELPFDSKIGGLVFVAGFSTDIAIPKVNPFIETPVNFKKIHAHTHKIVTIVSRDDDRVPLDKALEFQKNLEAELILEDHMGHFNERSGVIYLEIALQSILKMADYHV